MTWKKPQAGALTEVAAVECATYILDWLERRNGGELREALERQRVGDRRRLRDELVWILQHGGRPDNWTGADHVTPPRCDCRLNIPFGETTCVECLHSLQCEVHQAHTRPAPEETA